MEPEAPLRKQSTSPIKERRATQLCFEHVQSLDRKVLGDTAAGTAGGEREAERRLGSAELVGAAVTVSACERPSLCGTRGIVARDSARCVALVTRGDELVTKPDGMIRKAFVIKGFAVYFDSDLHEEINYISVGDNDTAEVLIHEMQNLGITDGDGEAEAPLPCTPKHFLVQPVTVEIYAAVDDQMVGGLGAAAYYGTGKLPPAMDVRIDISRFALSLCLGKYDEYRSDQNETGTVEKPRLVAFQRCQSRLDPIDIRRATARNSFSFAFSLPSFAFHFFRYSGTCVSFS